MASPLRWLDGIAYWVIDDPDAIYEFVNKQLRKEWEEDARSEERDPIKDEWLQDLSIRSWELTTMETSRIKLDPQILNRVDTSHDYNFAERLKKRSAELRRSIESFGTVIWPLIVRAENFQLVDGYCRYQTLHDLSIPRVYVYVGKL